MITLSSKWSLPDSISIWAIILSHTLVLYLQAECKMKHIKVWRKWKKVIVLKAFFFSFFSDNRKVSNPNLRPFWYLNSSDVSGRRFHTEGEKQFLVTFQSPQHTSSPPSGLTWPFFILRSTWTCSSTKTPIGPCVPCDPWPHQAVCFPRLSIRRHAPLVKYELLS